MLLNDIKLGYLGDVQSNHYYNIVTLSKKLNKEIYVLEHSLTNKTYKYNMRKEFNLDKKSINLKRLYRIYSQIFGLKDSCYQNILIDYFEKYPVDCMLAYWGTNPISDIISIKKYRPSTRIILNILCHPMGLRSPIIFLQNRLLRLAADYCDGFIYSSNLMKNYFERYVLKGKSIPHLVFPPFFSKDYFPDTRHSPCPNIPNLVFLGRMDWWAGQPTDNVFDQLQSLMNCGIHIYHSDKTGKLPFHEKRHVFAPMSLLDMKIFATQFDASLITYNVDACRRLDRFKITIPDRLITSVSCGIPIAIPRKGFEACKEFLQDYKAVIEFSSEEDLKEKLCDRKYMQELKSMALTNSDKYRGEYHLSELTDFICSQLD